MKEAFLAEYDNIVPDFVCCAPSHLDKGAKQGFDNVELLAKAFSKAMGFSFRKNMLKKIRKTGKQTDLGYRERLKNQVNSMIAAPTEIIKDKKILLIDDVCTTRATVIECSRALKKAGAKRVYVLTFATTTKENW